MLGLHQGRFTFPIRDTAEKLYAGVDVAESNPCSEVDGIGSAELDTLAVEPDGEPFDIRGLVGAIYCGETPELFDDVTFIFTFFFSSWQ